MNRIYGLGASAPVHVNSDSNRLHSSNRIGDDLLQNHPRKRRITPSMYPMCPFCHENNKGSAGKRRIRWSTKEERYICSSGHRFLRNGRPF